MAVLTKKIDFAIIMSVKNANPNGDPLNGNRPRTDYEGYGEVTDVCLKRKIRDRLVERYELLKKEKRENGQAILIQSDDRKCDDATSMRDRVEKMLGSANLKNQKDDIEKVCKEWIDVRAFGQLFAFKSDKKKRTRIPMGIPAPLFRSVDLLQFSPLSAQNPSVYRARKLLKA